MKVCIGLVVLAAMIGLAPACVQASHAAGSPRCDTTLEPTLEEELPEDVTAFADGTPIAGEGVLWLLINRPSFRTAFDIDDDQWVLAKVVWFRRQAGTIDIVERRSGSSQRVTVELSRGGYGETGFLPSHLSFPRAGCWRVSARLHDSGVRFDVRVPAGLQAVCDDIARQGDELSGIPIEENLDRAGALEAAADEKGC